MASMRMIDSKCETEDCVRRATMEVLSEEDNKVVARICSVHARAALKEQNAREQKGK